MTSVSGRTHTGLCTHSICRRSEGKGKISSYNWCIVLLNHITHWDHLPNESPLEAFCYFAVLGHLWRTAINRRRSAKPRPLGVSWCRFNALLSGIQIATPGVQVPGSSRSTIFLLVPRVALRWLGYVHRGRAPSLRHCLCQWTETVHL